MQITRGTFTMATQQPPTTSTTTTTAQATSGRTSSAGREGRDAKLPPSIRSSMRGLVKNLEKIHATKNH